MQKILGIAAALLLAFSTPTWAQEADSRLVCGGEGGVPVPRLNQADLAALIGDSGGF